MIILLLYVFGTMVKQKVWKFNEHQGKQFHFFAKMITLDDLCLGKNDRKITFEWYGIYSRKIILLI